MTAVLAVAATVVVCAAGWALRRRLPVGRADTARNDVEAASRRSRALSSNQCSGWFAPYCPAHGLCTCHPETQRALSFGHRPPLVEVACCPLHDPASTHANGALDADEARRLAIENEWMFTIAPGRARPPRR